MQNLWAIYHNEVQCVRYLFRSEMKGTSSQACIAPFISDAKNTKALRARFHPKGFTQVLNGEDLFFLEPVTPCEPRLASMDIITLRLRVRQVKQATGNRPRL